jgi:PAS domain S-box-containing protein
MHKDDKMPLQNVQKRRIETFRIVAIYSLFGLAWIYGSDTVLGWLVQDSVVMVKIAVIKGSLFIFCTATLLYFLINRFVRQLISAESDRMESLINYQTIFNTTNEAILVHDAQSGRILDINNRMLEIYGYTRAEALTVEIGDLSEGAPPYSQVEASENVRKALLEGIQVFQWHSRKKNGELFWSEVSLRRITIQESDRIIAVVRDISGRKQLEDVLRMREIRHQAILDSAMDGFWVVSHDGRIMEVNDAYCQMSGYSKQELLNMSIADFDVQETADDAVAHNNKIMAQGCDRFVARHRRKDGTVYDVEVSATFMPIEGGILVGFLRDITERKLAEESLRKSKATFKAFYDLGLVGLTITSPEKGWININDCLCNMLGYTEAELRTMTWEQVTHPDDLDADSEQFGRVLEGEIDGYELEKRFITRSGEIIFTKLVVRCVRKTDRSVEFIAAMVEDISEREQIENDLRDAEWKFKALFENGPIGVAYHSMIYDELGKPEDYYFIDANENYLELTGVDPRGKTVTQAFPGIENDPFDWIGTFGQVAKTGKPIHFEQYLQSNDRWYDVVGYQYKPDHFVASFVEITDRKRAEETLHESEFRWKFALEGAGDGVWDWNIQAGEAYYSPRYKEMLGYSEDEIGNTSDEWLKRIHPDDVTGVMTALKPYIEGKAGTASVEYRMSCKDGCWKSILGRGMVVSCDSNGKPLRMIGTNTDLTERKTVEQERRTLELQMQQAQKLESLGVLAGGIAHDFNNILMAIMGNADLALMRINKESPAVENLHRIEQAAARAADLAKQMLAYSGKGKFVIENIDLNILLEEMLHMLEVSISKKAVLRLNPHTPLPSVEADATQMRQIIMNLVINASEAIGDKSGVIAITTGCMDCDRNYLNDVWLDENISEGLYVYLEIADTGCGMDKATLAKLFDPFFTTKFTGRGLGMAAVLGIVRGHKGAIKVYSEPKRGTTFKILLPASNRPIEIFNGASHHDDWKGEGTVLLVDDEETVRGIGSEMLKELGFSVITADDGREGVEAFRNNPDISFVVLDLTMPHMDGEQCFRELRHIKSDVKVIMSSGYNEQEVTQKFVGKGLAGFIQKPYKLSVLREAIQKI